LTHVARDAAMTRVLVVGFAPLPLENLRMNGPSWRTWHFVAALLEAGHEVCLIANRGVGVYPDDLPDLTLQRKDALTYLNVSHSQWRTPAGLLPHIAAFAPHCALGVTTTGAAAAVEAAGDLPLWADLYGSVMAEAQMKAAVYGDDSYLAHFLRLEYAPVWRADRFSTVSERQQWALVGELGILGRLNQYTVGYAFVTTIPVGSETAPLVSTRTLLRGAVVPPDAFVILYSGGYNTWTDVDSLFAALEQVLALYPHVAFVSTGGKIDGHDDLTFARFRTLIAQSAHRHRYHLQGWVPAADLPSYYLESNVAVNVDKPSYEALLGSRTRALEWLRAGLPCVMSSLPELAERIATGGAGLIYRPGDVPDLVACLRRCIDSPTQLQAMRERTGEVLAQFSYQATTRDFLQWIAQPTRSPDAGKKIRPLLKLAPPARGLTPTTGGFAWLLLRLWRRITAIAARIGVQPRAMRRLAKLGKRWLGVDRVPFAVQYAPLVLPTPIRATSPVRFEVTLTNRGTQPWLATGDHPIVIAARWLPADPTAAVREAECSPLPRPIRAGERLTLPMTVTAPTLPGHYRLELDVQRQGVAGFAELGSPALTVPLEVQ
jgi:glycosyltransferase involved in cell wall biosynthesis